MERTIKRGDIYRAELDPIIGSEQSGTRPVLIISNDTGNRFSPTVIIAPITSRISAKPKLPTHTLVEDFEGLDKVSIILSEQIRTIDKHRLGKYIGHLKPHHIEGLNRALAVSIHLNFKQKPYLTICLCGTCADNFRSTGAYFLRRTDPHQTEKDTCTYCNQRAGYDFEITPKNT